MKKGQKTETNPAANKKPGTKSVKLLIDDLNSEDGLVRVRARKALVETGHKAVGRLVTALGSKKQWVRWEAAKALGQIGDKAAAQALINALEDKNFDVRWLAAEGLISIGQATMVPLLRAAIEQPDSLWLHEGLHHVLHNMEGGHLNKIIDPVLNALESFEPSVETPLAARKALDSLTKSQK
jgi:hypothetical protein